MNPWNYAILTVWAIDSIFAFLAGNFLAGVNGIGFCICFFCLMLCERRCQLLRARLSAARSAGQDSSVCSC
jgi:hypothetical protein